MPKRRSSGVNLELLQKRFKKAQEDLEKIIAEKERAIESKEEINEEDQISDDVSQNESGNEEFSDPEFEPQDDNLEDQNQTTEGNIGESENKEIAENKEGSEPIEKPLDAELTEVLGNDPTESKTLKVTLHSSVQKRWKHWYEQGMKKEERTELLEKYGNIKDILTPKINPALEMTLAKPTKTRDNYMQLRQNLANSALSSLGLAANSLIGNNEKIDRKLLFNSILDAGTLIADLMHCQTKSRRSALLATMPRNKRELLQTTKPDEFLFGEKLPEKFKELKSWENLFTTKYTNKKQSSSLQRQPLNSISLQENKPRSYQAGMNQGYNSQKRKTTSRFQTQPRTYDRKSETTAYQRKPKEQHKYK